MTSQDVATPPSAARERRVPFGVQYCSRLVEDVVLLAMRNHAEEGRFLRERDRLYEIQDLEEQEAGFREFHGNWFRRMALHRPIQQALDERPIIAAATSRCLAAAAKTRMDEGVELFVAPPAEGVDEVARRVIGLQIRPQSFLEPDALLALLRHEFLHIVYMVDPSFGYEPSLLHPKAKRTHIPLLQARYRGLWDAMIDGQLVLEEKAPPTLREHRLRDFRRVFPMLGEQTEEAFARFFDKPFHTHSDLIACAHSPEKMLPGSAQGSRRSVHCPLCGFATYAFNSDPESLTRRAVSRITNDFPAWRPEQGLCEQCAELYQSQAASCA